MNEAVQPSKEKFGFVALIGLPNAGKSTLLNHFLDQRISIVSRKPQTTRHRIHGILTLADTQAVFVDTPGINTQNAKALNDYMNQIAYYAINDCDLILYLKDANQNNHLAEQSEAIEAKITASGIPYLIILNKIDQLDNRNQALPKIQDAQKTPFGQAALGIIPISAAKGFNIPHLWQNIASHLSEGPFMYEPQMQYDRTEAFFAAEIIREPVFNLTGQELPYSTTVHVESLKREEKILKINAIIYVERKGQKIILLGKQGEMIKRIASQSRLNLEKFFQQKVYLTLWIKVKKQWSNQPLSLSELGYE